MAEVIDFPRTAKVVVPITEPSPRKDITGTAMNVVAAELSDTATNLLVGMDVHGTERGKILRAAISKLRKSAVCLELALSAHIIEEE